MFAVLHAATLQVLFKPGMAHAGILVNTAWQATAIEAFSTASHAAGALQARGGACKHLKQNSLKNHSG
jgi:hypothetical protein